MPLFVVADMPSISLWFSLCASMNATDDAERCYLQRFQAICHARARLSRLRRFPFASLPSGAIARAALLRTRKNWTIYELWLAATEPKAAENLLYVRKRLSSVRRWCCGVKHNRVESSSNCHNLYARTTRRLVVFLGLRDDTPDIGALNRDRACISGLSAATTTQTLLNEWFNLETLSGG